MSISYDYEEMIQELQEELSDGILSLTDNIQILRDDKDIGYGYRPIIDWYYDDNTMTDDLNADIFDDEQDIEEKRHIKELYEKVKFLEVISVANCLFEMEELDKII